MDSSNPWSTALSAIRNRISRQNYDIWFSQISLKDIEGDEIHLEVPNRYFQDWIQANYQELILQELESQGYVGMHLVYHHGPGAAPVEPPSQSPREDIAPPPVTPPPTLTVNVEQTFQTFVVGSSNQFAHAASLAVAENPARDYNPLFIYGGVGLGKTHLLNAIGNSILAKDASARVVYLSSEEFVNELITSIRFERMNEFRNKYRNTCDALLVDDIQFLAGKIRTQEEFFYTFNALHASGKQIVVTSDKFPKEIPGLEERLRNRFEWGLIADIQPPDHETKVAILKKKTADQGVALPDDVCHFIASNVKSSVRELEGILVRLMASASFYKRDIDLDFARQVLNHIIDNGQPALTIQSIQEAVGRFYNLKQSELKSHRKNKQLVWPRQLAMYLCRQHTDRSFPEIGQSFGGRDHTTVIHSVKKIEKLIDKDPSVAEVLRSIEKTLGI